MASRIACMFPVVFVIAGIAGAICVGRARTSEPTYHNREASVWVDEYYKGLQTGHWIEAKQALLQLGTNAVPHLVRLAATPGPSGPKNDLIFLLLRKPSLGRFLGMYDWARREASLPGLNPSKACEGFKLLGTKGASAVPQLIRIMRASNNEHGRRMAAHCLAEVGPPAIEAVPALLENLRDGDTKLRAASCKALLAITYDETNARWREGSRIVPELLRLLEDPKADVRRVVSLLSLPNDGPDAEQTRIALARYAGHSDPKIREAINTSARVIAN